MLKNKVAVITGCNRGIGLKILEKFSENGADIFACARNVDENILKKIEDLQLKYKNKIFPLKFDLQDKDTILLAAKEINKYDKNLNIIINNAGLIHNKLFQLTKLEEFYQTFEVNFFNQILFVQSLLRNINKSKNGSIVFLSSSAAQDGNIGRAAYSSSKAALAAFAKVLSRELGNQNVRVNTVSPGLTQTDMMTGSTSKEYLEKIVKEIPLNRIADPEDISKLILYLSSDLSKYITGQDLRIDGGLK